MSARGVVLGVSELEKEGRDWPPNIHVQNLMETRVLEVSKFQNKLWISDINCPDSRGLASRWYLTHV